MPTANRPSTPRMQNIRIRPNPPGSKTKTGTTVMTASIVTTIQNSVIGSTYAPSLSKVRKKRQKSYNRNRRSGDNDDSFYHELNDELYPFSFHLLLLRNLGLRLGMVEAEQRPGNYYRDAEHVHSYQSHKGSLVHIKR